MKKIILVLSLVAIALSSCNLFRGTREAILEKANKTAENIGYQLETTKMGVQKKVGEIEDATQKVKDATQKVKDAADAVKKVGE